MSSRRHHEGYYDAQSGPQVAPQKDTYKVWVPPTKSESERPRYKTATGHPETVSQGASGRRHGESKHRSSSRVRPDVYTTPAASSHQNTPIPSSSKAPQSRPPISYNSGKQPSQVASSASQVPPYAQTPSRSHAQRSQAESYDPQPYLQKRTTAGPSPQSSYEKVSGAENGTKNARPIRSGNGQVAAASSATPAPAMWVPPAQAPSSSTRHGEKEPNRESIRYREKAYDRYKEKERDEADARHQEREKIREREKLRERENKELGYRERGKTREKEKQRERGDDQLESKNGKNREQKREQERLREWGRDRDEAERKYRPQEREARSHGDPERVSKPSSSARKGQDNRADDPDSSDSARRNPVVTASGHRRHRTEEGTSSTAVDRRYRGERSRPLSSAHAAMPLGSSNTTVLAPGTTLSTTNDLHGATLEQSSPPTPRVMPVYLPDKKVKSHRSHYTGVPSLPADILQSGLSGSDTERAKRRELRHPATNHSSNLRGHHLENSTQMPEDKLPGSSSRLETTRPENLTEMPTRASLAEPQKESKGLSSRWPFNRSRQSSAPNPPENRTEVPPINTHPLPAEKYKERSVAPQFVSIRAGQGPSDPQISDALYKLSVSSRPEDHANTPISNRPPLHPQDSRLYDIQRPDTMDHRLQTSSVEHTSIPPTSESSAYAANVPPVPLRPLRHQSSSRHESSVVASQQVPSTTQPSRSTSHNVIPSDHRPADRSKVVVSQAPVPIHISSRSASYNNNLNESRPSALPPVDLIRQAVPPTPVYQTVSSTSQNKLASASSYAAKLNESQLLGAPAMASGSTRHSPSSTALAASVSTGPSLGVSKESQFQDRPLPSETFSALHTPKVSTRTGSNQAGFLETRPSAPLTKAHVSHSLPTAPPPSTPPSQSTSLAKNVTDNARSNEVRQSTLPVTDYSVREQAKPYELQLPNPVKAYAVSLHPTSRQHYTKRSVTSLQMASKGPHDQEPSYVPVGSKRDAEETPQVSVSASQATHFHSSKPAEQSLKRDTERVPQISVSASQAMAQPIHLYASKPSEPYTHVGSKRDLGEKTAVPPISASALQTASQTTLHQHPKSSEPSHTPVSSKRDLVEKTAAPHISISTSQTTQATLHYPKPSEPNYTPMGSKRDLADKTAAQVPASASQTAVQATHQHPKPSEPNPTPAGSKRDAEEAPQISVAVSQNTVQTTPHPSKSAEPSYAPAGSKRDFGEKIVAPQMSASASQTTVQTTAKPSEPSSTPVGSKRDLMEKVAAPQISISTSQTTTFHQYSKPSETISAPVGSKRDLGEKATTPQLSTTALQSTPKSPHHRPKAPDVISPNSPNSTHTPTPPASNPSGSQTMPNVLHDYAKSFEVIGLPDSSQVNAHVTASKDVGYKRELVDKSPGPQSHPSPAQPSPRSTYDQGKPETRSSPLATESQMKAMPPPFVATSSKRELAEKHTAPQISSQTVPKYFHDQAKLADTRPVTSAPDSRLNLVSSKFPFNEDSPPRRAPYNQTQPPSSHVASRARFYEELSSDPSAHRNTLSASHQSTATPASPTLARRSPSYNTQSNDVRCAEPLQVPSGSSPALQQHIPSKDAPKVAGVSSSAPDAPSNAVSTLHSILYSNSYSRTPPSMPVSQPPSTSRLYAQSSENRNAGQSHAPASALQQFPPRAQSYDTSSNVPVVSSTPVSHQTPSPISKPLTHQTNSSDMPPQTSSRSNETPRMTIQTPVYPSSSIYRSQSHTAFPEESAAVHVANPKTHDHYSSDSRLVSSMPPVSQLHTPTTAQPSASRAQEGAKKVHGSYPTHVTHATATLATSSGASRSTQKSYTQHIDSAVRARETVHSNSSQSHSTPHRSGPSASHNSSSQQASSSTHNRQHTVSLPSSAITPNPVPMSQSRTQTHTLPRSAAPSTQAISTSTRVPVSNHLSVPQISRSASSDSELLKTPSSLAPSLAPSMLLKPISSAPTPVSSQTPPESHRKGNFFNRFRQKKSGDPQPYEIWNPPAFTKAPARNELRSQERPPEKNSTRSGPTSREKTSAPVDIPIHPSSGRKSPEQKIFTPFRLFTSKRHRTISAASLDATDGTATNTLIGSPTTSIHSQALMPPPFRDPLTAAHQWRNNEEAQMKGRGTARRRRPGVTFDVVEDHPENYGDNRDFE